MTSDDAIEISNKPELSELADEVSRTRRPRALRRGGRTVAVVVPAPRVRYANHRPRRRKEPGLGPNDTLWNIIGIIDDPGGPTDVSSNKHKYLADIYYAEGHPGQE